jgi:hypothetical protein
MSACASVSFTFDGNSDTFDQIYDDVCAAVREVALDIGTFFDGTLGSIDFIVDDYMRFEAIITAYSAESGIRFTAANSLSYGPEA